MIETELILHNKEVCKLTLMPSQYGCLGTGQQGVLVREGKMIEQQVVWSDQANVCILGGMAVRGDQASRGGS